MKRETRFLFAAGFGLFVIICVLVLINKALPSNKVETTFVLQQVLIVSRHNARTPTSKILSELSPHTWPKYEEQPGYLTKKGFLLEGFMGKYFSSWFAQENLLNDCPSQDDLYVYANSMERTLSSAEAFIKEGYPNCNISIHHENQSDPVFSPIIHNTSSIFKEIAIKEMYNILNEFKLNISYMKMEHILNYEESELCKVKKKCHLTLDKNEVDIIVGKKPYLSGPLKISNEAVDAFLMAYYNGFHLEDIGWGNLKTEEDWNIILKLAHGYHNVIFNTTHVSADLAMPLLKYMRDILVNKDYKATLLMGHDANIHVLLKLLAMKPFFLSESFVNTPIGGKLVFQKWLNTETKKYYLKIHYVYQSTKQLRNGIRLSLKNPPLFQILQLNDCTTDAEGYCPWDEFIEFIKSF